MKYSDKFRKDYKIYLEPVLASACSFMGYKKGLTRSKYIRLAVILMLVLDGYPLIKITEKFNDLIKWLKINILNKGISQLM